MSLTQPDKLDDLRYNLRVYLEFMKDPEVRTNTEMVQYFMDKINICLVHLEVLNNE